MAEVLDGIDERLGGWLLRQHVFFVGTAPAALDGHVNVSPKGVGGTFAVLDPLQVAYLDLTGSGVETVAHLRDNGRITLMFCAFDGPPDVVRLQGRGEVVLPEDPAYDGLLAAFRVRPPGIRSVVRVRLDRVSSACGFAVPLMDHREDRTLLSSWAQRRGPAALEDYRAQKNARSVDGLPGLPVPTPSGR